MSLSPKQQQLLPPLWRALLTLEVLALVLYPALLLLMACVLSIGVILGQLREPSWEGLVVFAVAGGIWGLCALLALLFHTLIRPNADYSPNTMALIAGMLSCVAVISTEYSAWFLWLMFSAPILVTLQLLWLRRYQGLH